MASLSTSSAMASPLLDYLSKEEPVYEWKLADSQQVEGMDVHTILLTSQTWQEYVWKHQLTIVVPQDMRNPDTCLLFVTGGSADPETGQPRMRDLSNDEIRMIGQVAQGSGSPAAVLFNVPRQPIFNGLVEDEIISLTFQKYMETGDPTLPLLFPMVKSAVKAMDALQELSEQEMESGIGEFVVCGGSKRGWTTWLTGASDERVAAIAPMVIDMLNWDKHIPYHLEMWDRYSPQISDYTEKSLPQMLKTERGEDLKQMVDPYAYREHYTMPKLIMIGANDPYWPLDSIKWYFDDLPGPKFIHYTPNAGHGLGDGRMAIESLTGFFATEAAGMEHPKLEWSVEETADGFKFELHTGEGIQAIRLWETTSSDRDFRNNLWTVADTIGDPQAVNSMVLPYPDKGYHAFIAEARFESPAGGTYGKCSQVMILTPGGLLK